MFSVDEDIDDVVGLCRLRATGRPTGADDRLCGWMMACDIELEISAGASPGEFTTRVVDAPSGGEPTAAMQLDVDGLLRDRDALEATVLASGVSGRGLSSAEEQLRRVGRQLFDALFSGPVMGTYRASLGVALQQGQPLRVVLRLRTPQLAALPWEALFDPETGAYVCRTESLVRHVPAPYTPEPLEVVPPLRVLGLVASPRGLPTLDVGAEQERLSRALATPIADGLIELEWLAQASWEAVQEKLLSGVWHVLHFIGHGDYDASADQGLIALVGEDGRANLVEAARLADLLNEAHPTPRLVVLNSCSSGEEGTSDLFSGTAAALVRSGISAVAAMQFTVSDSAAIAFAKGFYTAIAHGHSIDDATRSGRIAILGIPHTLEWVTPVLYVRGDATELFRITDAPPTSARAPGPPRPEKPTAAAGGFALGGRTMDRLRRTLTRRPVVSTLAVTGVLAVVGALVLGVFTPEPVRGVPVAGPDGLSRYGVTTVPVGRKVAGLAVAASSRVYVTSPDNDSLSVIDIDPNSRTHNQVIPDPIELRENPTGVAVDPHSGNVFVTGSESGAGTVWVIRGSKVISVGGLKNLPVAVTVGNGTVYAVGPPAPSAAESSGTVAVITTGPTPTTTPAPPTDKSVTPAPMLVYGVREIVPVGNTPNGVAVDPTNNTVYVTNYFGDPSDPLGTVSVIKPNGSNFDVQTVPVGRFGKHPDGVAVDERNSTVYVALFGELSDPFGTVLVIKPNGSNYDVEPVRVGKNPDAVAVDPVEHAVYVTNNLPGGKGAVSVIDTDRDSPSYNQVTDVIPVGENPCSVAVAQDKTVYVANCGDDKSVSVIKRR